MEQNRKQQNGIEQNKIEENGVNCMIQNMEDMARNTTQTQNLQRPGPDKHNDYSIQTVLLRKKQTTAQLNLLIWVCNDDTWIYRTAFCLPKPRIWPLATGKQVKPHNIPPLDITPNLIYRRVLACSDFPNENFNKVSPTSITSTCRRLHRVTLLEFQLKTASYTTNGDAPGLVAIYAIKCQYGVKSAQELTATFL